ncbi:hypothetical protein CLAIMM_04703 [Cladophialophora immunda]|nr:hypothetical protein CLAIMM_04703 [Cladophialophora immunda]
MRILITVKAQDDLLRTTVSVMDADIEPEDGQALHELQHEQTPPEEDTTEAAAKAVMVADRSTAQWCGNLSTESCSFRHFLTPNTIHITVQLLSVLAFCALLLPYLQYTRAKKAVVCDACKQNAWSQYESKLAQCDAEGGTQFGFRGRALGLNWMEYGTILLAATAWQYVVWHFQGWIIVRVCFVKTASESY